MITCLPCEVFSQPKTSNIATKFLLNPSKGSLAIPLCEEHAKVYNYSNYIEITKEDYLLQQLKLKL